MYLAQTPRSVPSTLGRGEREQIFVLFKPEFDSEFSGRCNLNKHRDQSPLPSGRGEREQIFVLFKPEFDSEFQVGVPRTNTAISPLSLRERARVRAAIFSRTKIPNTPA